MNAKGTKQEKFSFEKLEVYKRSLNLTKALCQIASKFPYKFCGIRDQLIRAIISVPLNIAEGSGRESKKERKNFYRISQASLFECIPLIEICNDLKLINHQKYKEFRKEITELSKMVNGLIKSLHS